LVLQLLLAVEQQVVEQQAVDMIVEQVVDMIAEQVELELALLGA
tara:strand:+ start:477 stop:608 length:132 start_codon:yes stop_codon:yes gene_type:complete